MHDSWGPVRNQLVDFLQAITLERLVEQRRIAIRPQSAAAEIGKLNA
jgi:DNA-binding IscR family transcriptional regulator